MNKLIIVLFSAVFLTACNLTKQITCPPCPIYDSTIVNTIDSIIYNYKDSTIIYQDTLPPVQLPPLQDTNYIEVFDTTHVIVYDTIVGQIPEDTNTTEKPPVYSNKKTGHVFWAENFENMSSFDPTTIKKLWQYRGSFFPAQDNELVNSTWGKCLQVTVRKGVPGATSGLSIDVPLDSATNDMYISYYVWVNPEFSCYSTSGNYSGKVGIGLMGGNLPFNNLGCWCQPDVTTRNPNRTVNGPGWSTNMIYGSKNRMSPYMYDQAADGAQNQIITNLTLPLGKWVHVVTHIRLNTPGNRDGIYQCWVDGKNVGDQKFEWNNAAQIALGLGKIGGIHITFFNGGGGNAFILPVDNLNRLDNIVVSDTINPYKDYIPTFCKYAKKMNNDTVYTANSDTVNGIRWGEVVPFATSFADSCTKLIKTTGSSITFTIPYWQDGFNYTNSNGEMESWLKIYYLKDGNWILYKWFQESGEMDGTPSGTYIVPSGIMRMDCFFGNDTNRDLRLIYKAL